MPLPAPLLRRNNQVHKKTFGHLLVCAGSANMLGAACLVALAAMRSGAGLVTAAIPKRLNTTLQCKIAHAIMTLPVPAGGKECFGPGDAVFLGTAWPRFSAVALGPGIGTALPAKKFAEHLIRACPLPMVVDADALASFTPPEGDRIRIVTPHPGEFLRLTGEAPVTDSQRRQAALRFSQKNKVVLVLKGRHTVIAGSSGKLHVDKIGSAALAKAGTGDVLTGIIAGLLAQGVPPFEAAKNGVILHGMAARRAGLKNRFSLLATDLIDQLKRIPA